MEHPSLSVLSSQDECNGPESIRGARHSYAVVVVAIPNRDLRMVTPPM